MNPKANIETMLQNLKDWGKVLILLLDEVVVIAAIVLLLRFLEIGIPLPIMIVGGILLGVLILIVHIAVIPSLHKKQVTGREGMVGEQGRVVDPLTPYGTVIVRGEYWKARSVDEDDVEIGEYVEIVGNEGLTLDVKRKTL